MQLKLLLPLKKEIKMETPGKYELNTNEIPRKHKMNIKKTLDRCIIH